MSAEKFKLYDYQIPMIAQAVEAIKKHRVVYLASETRVGKTAVSILAAQRYVDDEGKDYEIVFVTKAGVMSSITEQIKTLRDAGLLKRDVLVVSVDSLHKLQWKRDTIFILDEAHSVGAYPLPSKRAIQMREVCSLRPVILLSATPTPESYTMIFHQFWAVGCEDIFGSPGMNFWQFAARYVDVYTETRPRRGGAPVMQKNYSRAKWNLIEPIIAPHRISTTKADAGFAHTDVETTIYRVQIPAYLRKAIDEIKPPKRKKGEPEPPSVRSTEINGVKITVRSPAETMSKIHQLCSGTVIDNDDNKVIVSTHKIAMVDRALHEFGKIAVFYKFVAEKEMLSMFYGDRLTDDPIEFQDKPGMIFCGQFQSKREGIDLSSAGALVFFNIDHAYLSYEQTKNRIMNYKRKETPHLVLIFSQDGIEEKIYKCVLQKKNFTAAHYTRQGEI